MIVFMLGLLTFILYRNLEFTKSRWEKNPSEINLLGYKFDKHKKYNKNQNTLKVA